MDRATLGWEAAENGARPEQADELTEGERPKLSQVTALGWLLGFHTQRGER